MKHSRPTRGCQKARTTAARWNDLLGCLASALHASQREVTHSRSASHTDWQRRQVDAASITATGQHEDSVAYTQTRERDALIQHDGDKRPRATQVDVSWLEKQAPITMDP